MFIFCTLVPSYPRQWSRISRSEVVFVGDQKWPEMSRNHLFYKGFGDFHGRIQQNQEEKMFWKTIRQNNFLGPGRRPAADPESIKSTETHIKHMVS